MTKLFDKSIYLVTDRSLSKGRTLVEVVEQAVKGGVSMVQLREKDCTSREFYQQAMALKQCLAPYNVPLIINDRVDIALACDAEGLHIGNSDLPFEVARKLLTKNKIIGLSVESIEDAKKANLLDVDYIGVSPVFSTPTKTDTAPALGLDGLRAVAHISRHPIVGIGGINKYNIEDVIRAGADSVAVVSALMSAPSPEQATQELIQIIKTKI